MTGPRGADGSLRANRFGSVATKHEGARTAYVVALPDLPGGGGPAAAAEQLAVGLEHLVLDWLDADAAPGEATLAGRQQRLVEQTADVELVARLLAEPGVDPNAAAHVSDGNGHVDPYTPLTRAAELGHLEAVRLLVDAGADPGRADSDGATPLTNAAMNGYLEAAQLLLDAGADLDGSVDSARWTVDCDGFTPLMSTAVHGQLEVLRLLLGRGAAVDAVDPTGRTAFHYACGLDQAECAEALARTGCDVGLKTTAGETGQQRAEAQGSKDVLRRLRALARQPFVGVLVELAGLVGAAEHNGKRATVISERPSCDHHTSVFLARARMHVVCTLCEHRRTLCVAVEWRWN